MQSWHKISLLEFLGEYEGIKIGPFNNYFDGTRDNEDEELLLGFMEGSQDKKEEDVVDILLDV